MISGIQALRAYFKLTPEQKTFLRDKTYDASMPANEWLALIEQLSILDHHLDRFRALSGWVSFISTFLWAFQLFFIRTKNHYTLGAGVFFLLVFLFARRADLHNNLRRFVLPMLRIVQMELRDDTLINMQLDLRGNDFHTKLTDTRESSRRKDEIYFDPWLTASTRLRDGSSLKWAVTEKFRERTQTNPRGKVKMKYKRKRRYEVQLGVSKSRYKMNDKRVIGLDKGTTQGKQKKGEKRDQLRLRKQTVDTGQLSYADVYEFADLLYTAYSTLEANTAKEGK